MVDILINAPYERKPRHTVSNLCLYNSRVPIYDCTFMRFATRSHLNILRRKESWSILFVGNKPSHLLYDLAFWIFEVLLTTLINSIWWLHQLALEMRTRVALRTEPHHASTIIIHVASPILIHHCHEILFHRQSYLLTYKLPANSYIH